MADPIEYHARQQYSIDLSSQRLLLAGSRPQIGVTKAVCLGHGYNLRSERNKRLIYQFERTEDSIRSDRMAVAPQSGTHAQCFRVIASLTG